MTSQNVRCRPMTSRDAVRRDVPPSRPLRGRGRLDGTAERHAVPSPGGRS